MTGPSTNVNSNSESVVIDIREDSQCNTNEQIALSPAEQTEVPNNERIITYSIQEPQVSEGGRVPYIDRFLGTNFPLPRVYSFFPLMNGLPAAHQNDNGMATQLNENVPIGGNAVINSTVRASESAYPGPPNTMNIGITSAEPIQPPAVDFNAPPPYDAPLKLPTYEEVQREKALQGELPIPYPGCMAPQEVNNGQSTHTLAFLTIDAGDIGPNSDPETKLLGTDFMFLLSFMIALFFNWIGFLLLMCFCHTVAARYGALSGFGLSLAKWTVIVKGATDMPVQNGWLWWLITAFGLLICVRSFFQYINIKKGWRLMSAATQERLLFFY